MRHPPGFSLQSGFNDGIPGGLVVMRFAPASGGNLPHLADALITHPFPPEVHSRPADAEEVRHRLVVLASKCSQDDPATKRHLPGSAVG